jgi:hypothetical protein
MSRVTLLILVAIGNFLFVGCANRYAKNFQSSGGLGNGRKHALIDSKQTVTFLLENGKYQYFVKPLTYVSKDKENAAVDFTFQGAVIFQENDSSSLRAAITWETQADITVKDSISFIFLDESKEILPLEKIYFKEIEKKGKNIYRFACYRKRIASPYNKVLSTKEGFIIRINSDQYLFKPTSKTKKRLR